MKIIDKKNKKMTSKKLILGYLAALMAICVILPLNAVSQGYAGPTKTILKDSSVVIGAGSCANCCYLWTPTTGLSDPKIAKPIAKPTATTTYTLKVTGNNFTINDVSQMTVTVKDGLSGLTVVPKQCCWNKGDAITLDQFTITTDPPGLEGTVTVSPTSIPTNIFATSVGTLPLVFTGKGPNNTTITTTVTISAVDKDVQISETTGLGQFKPEKILDVIDKIAKGVELGACQKTGGPTANITFTAGKLCCPKAGCIKDMYSYNGTYNYSIGVECDYPFYGIPYIASVNARIMVSAGAALSLGNITTAGDGVDDCISIGINGSIGGGVSATVLAGKVLNASLLIVGTITPDPIEYCMPSGKTKCLGNICVKADIVGTIKLLSFITKSVKVNLISQRCWN